MVSLRRNVKISIPYNIIIPFQGYVSSSWRVHILLHSSLLSSHTRYDFSVKTNMFRLTLLEKKPYSRNMYYSS